MKQELIVLIIAAVAAYGCSDSDEGRLADDDTLAIGAPTGMMGGMHNGTGPDSGHAMGSMMGGNMNADMEMMDRMMVEHLGAADSMYDARFIRMMIPHHEGAVMMAQDALDKSVHPELRQLAEAIIAEQKKEIAQMQSWLSSWYPGAAADAGMGAGSMGADMTGRMEQMNRMMVTGLAPKDSAYDDRFITMMIPHHQGAVAMAKDALNKAQHPEMKAFAQKIIEDQDKEIRQMTEWRTRWYGR